MTDFDARLAGLSERKQQLLRQLLASKAKTDAGEGLTARAAGSEPLPLSAAQRGLWFLCRLAPDNAFYHMPYAVHLDGALDSAALQRAFDTLLRRHEALRTVFPERGGRPVQQVLPPSPFTLPRVDLGDVPEGEREAQALRRAARDALAPFDLAAGPLFRAALYRLGERSHLLMFCMHHIVSDGWSVGVMAAEVGTLYQAFRQGLPDPLPALPVQYADWALWQQTRLGRGALDGQLAYWRERLADVTPLALPTDRPRPAVQSFRGASEPVQLPAALSADLEALARREGATLFMTLLTGFQALLFLHSGTRRVVVGTPVANRRPKETEPLIGFFANTLALCTDCAGDPSFRALLERARETTLGAFAHQDTPFDLLVESLRVERDPGRNPLFQVMFGLQSVAMREFALPGLAATPRNLDNDTTHFDLELHLWHREGHLGGYLSYNVDLFERATIQRLLAQLQGLLETAAAEPGTRLSELAASLGIDPAGDRAARLEAALAAHPAVAECAVLNRERGEALDTVAYVVPAQPFDPETLRRSLTPPPDALVPLSAIPHTADGRPDEAALRALPVIDAELLARWEQALRTRPGVTRVQVRAEEPRRPRPWLHLSDLLPAESPPPASRSAPSPTPTTGHPTGDRPAFADGGPLALPPQAPRTLGEALLRTAAAHPDKGLVLVQAGGEETFLSYPELLERARALLAGLQGRGLRPGDRVILQLGRLADHFCAFWACVLGGIVPVTVAQAPSYRERGGVVAKLWNMWNLLRRPVLLSDAALAPEVAALPALFDGDPEGAFRVWTVDELRGRAADARPHAADPDEVVFLQLTSGSTGIPKCVQETHRAIVHHIHGSQRVNGYRAGHVSLNWLPLDHVVPILTCHLRDTYLGMGQVQVATALVLAEPLQWLELIERHRASHTWAPNFGFKLVSDRLAREPARRRDLSCVERFMNAGEQVTESVLHEFLRLTAPFGVRPEAMQPAFGMAEVATCMTYRNGFDPRAGVHRVLKASLDGPLQAAPADAGPDAVAFVDLGPPMPGVQIRIADAAGRTLPERVIGRLQIRGAVTMPGYLDNEAANREAFVGDGWFDSGDLGFIADGGLALTGRAKETIIVRGANFYCHEVEEVVNAVDGVTPTFSAACGIQLPQRGTEGLAVFFVPRAAGTAPDPQLIRRVRSEVSRRLGITPDYIIPLTRGEFPKTTSGKIQRTQLKQALESGGYAPVLKAIDRAEENARCLPDWFFQRAWQPLPARPTAPPDQGTTLIFADTAGLAGHLAGGLPGAVRVEPGEAFLRLAPGHYRIDPRRPQDYDALLATLAEEGRAPARIVHLWSYADPAGHGADHLEQAQYRGAHSLLFLAQALGRRPAPPRPLPLLVCSATLHALADDERPAWVYSPLLGLLQSLEREVPWLACRHLDLPGGDPAREAEWVAQELATGAPHGEVAYRDGVRRIAHLERARLGPRRRLPFRRGGVYLLSGGLGGIGRTLAGYLLRQWGARVLLVGRTPLAGPDCENLTGRAPSESRERLEALAALARLDGEVLYAAADVGDPAQMTGVLQAALRRWSAPLDGVFHLAGSFHTRAVAEESAESLTAALRAKLQGARVLHELAPTEALFVHVASVNGVLGGAMAGAYSAANSALQAFSEFQRREGRRSHCVSFSLWDEVGMSRGYALKEQSRAQGFLPIDAERGIHSLLAALAADHPQLLVGLDGERPNIRRHLRRECRPLATLRGYVEGALPAPPPPLADRYGTPCPCELTTEAAPAQAQRAPAAGAGATPTTELQRTIAGIWQEVLELSAVGVEQNFFELGGQSLALVQVHSRLQEVLGREIPIVDLLQYPTVASLAKALGDSGGRGAALDEAMQRAQRQRASRPKRRGNVGV